MTIQGRQPVRQPPQLWEVWKYIKQLLVAGNFTKLLLGANRIYLASDQHKPAEDRLDQPWGRLVLVPIVTAWATTEEIGRDVLAPFLVRTDYYKPDDSNFDQDRWNDAAHAEVFRLLHGHGPVINLTYARIEHPIHRETPPQPMSVWDAERGVFYKSAVYHVYVSPQDIGG